MRFVLVRNDPLNLVHEYLLELFIVVTYIPILIHKSIEHKKRMITFCIWCMLYNEYKKYLILITNNYQNHSWWFRYICILSLTFHKNVLNHVNRPRINKKRVIRKIKQYIFEVNTFKMSAGVIILSCWVHINQSIN